jgi:DNA polymerase III subunit epsilon
MAATKVSSAPKDYCVIDIETTGGDPKVERITEIAVYRFDGQTVVDSFVSLVNPERPIPEFITRITGINNDMVQDAPKFFEIARRLVEITQDTIFVAHNARFDYGFVQKEFRQLGYTFIRKQLCTVRLTRKFFPGLRSYSLPNLCKHFQIQNEASHRAWGDATATLELFRRILAKSGGEDAPAALQQETAATRLPPQLKASKLDELPEETGVYYFYNQRHELIYVGKSTNIRKRVLSHFQGANKASRTMQMIAQIADLSFELTGSELVALLLENEEIKRHQPRFNIAQRRQTYKFAIYAREDEAGYLRLQVDAYDDTREPLAGYSGRSHAEASLKRRAGKYTLCHKLCGLEKGSGRCFHHQLHICQGACIGEEAPEAYNERVAKAMRELSFGKNELNDFLVIGEGRNYDERSVVWVQGGTYRGYGYVDPELLSGSLESLLAAVDPREECPDVQRIIRGYIKRHPKKLKVLDSAW